MPLSDNKYLAEIDNTTMEYGYTKAVDEQDAYMNGFTYCMDKIERAFLDKCGIFTCDNLKEEAKN